MIHVDNFAYGALNPVLAYLVSCVGCFAGLRCTTRARASTGAARAGWLVAAALAIATTGIWVMHFIAMLGFAIPGQPIRYNVPVTIASMLVAVLVVGAGTFIAGFGRGGTGPLLIGGSIIGVGVACMHYLGMAAIRVPDTLTYNPVLVGASVVIAVIAGTAALWAALRLDSLWSTLAASMIMGVAVSGMHYTGMAALQVRAAPGAAVSYAATASAEAFLLPLILSLCGFGFIFAVVIALSPTATEIINEARLMERLSPLPPHKPPAEGHPAQPGNLFRPRQPGRREDR